MSAPVSMAFVCVPCPVCSAPAGSPCRERGKDRKNNHGYRALLDRASHALQDATHRLLTPSETVEFLTNKERTYYVESWLRYAAEQRRVARK